MASGGLLGRDIDDGLLDFNPGAVLRLNHGRKIGLASEEKHASHYIDAADHNGG